MFLLVPSEIHCSKTFHIEFGFVDGVLDWVILGSFFALSRYFYIGSTFAITEMDGVRLIGQEVCDLIQKVPGALKCSFCFIAIFIFMLFPFLQHLASRYLDPVLHRHQPYYLTPLRASTRSHRRLTKASVVSDQSWPRLLTNVSMLLDKSGSLIGNVDF